jgi:hypothetical protein
VRARTACTRRANRTRASSSSVNGGLSGSDSAAAVISADDTLHVQKLILRTP